jgi:lipid-A-disaccharide synthase
MTKPQILISAGEASGEMYAAQLATALRRHADVHPFGLGGPRMREAGVELLADCSEVAVVGISEYVRRVPAGWRVLRRLVAESAQRHPALAVLVDSPALNLRLARRLRQQGVRNVYFICPQFWAWRPWRVRLVRRRFARALCIFPFEEKFYRDAGVPVDFVGHPLVDQVHPTISRAEFARRFNLDADQPIIALLPGSRASELAHNLPPMLEACHLLEPKRPYQSVLAVAPGLKPWQFADYARPDAPVRLVEGATYDALAAADLAIVSSGTATVEAALLGTPMVVVYRVSPTTAFVLRRLRLVRTPFFSMVNLIAGKRVVPELIQDDFTPERVAEEVGRLLGSRETREQMKRDLDEVRSRLGPGGAIERAAEIIARML